MVFESTKPVTDLASGTEETVSFDSWTAAEGFYTATVTTQLSGDENMDNDTIAESFTVFGEETYCFPSGDCSYGDGITDFAFAGIENYGSGCSDNGYGVFTYMEGDVEILSTYTATFSSGYSSNYVSVWIDFNNDLEFSAVERVLTDFPLGDPGELMAVDITIPGFAVPGATTMRIGANYSDPSSPDPCADLVYGEWEDYTLNISGTSVLLDAQALSVDLAPWVEQGSVTPVATVKNGGIEEISFQVTCSTDGYTSSKDVTALGSGQEYQLSFDDWTATPGEYDMEVTVSLDGDENSENDVVNKTISVVDYIPTKRVVGEEGTGTWCGWCVRGAVYMDSMAMKYPDNWIGIAVHNGDPMVVEEYDAGIGPLIGFAYPGGLVDRKFNADPSGFEQVFLERVNAISPAEITMETNEFNASTGELTFTVNADFVVSVSGYRFNAVIVENGVTGTGDGWDQANYYSGGGNGPMGGYEDLPDPVPAAMMVYEHVGRAILGGFDGVEGSLPENVNAGENHSWEFTTTLEEGWDYGHIEMVGLLIDNSTGEIVNAIKKDLLVTDVTEETALNRDLVVYPNPARDVLNIANIAQGDVYIFNINGQLLYSENHVAGNAKVDISGFENGTYIVQVIGNNQAVTRKFNIVK